MALAYDSANGFGQTGLTASVTWSHTAFTVASGIALMVLDVSFGEQSGNVVGRTWTVTWGSQTMTQFGTEVQPASTTMVLRRYTIANPTAGNQTLTCNFGTTFGGGGFGTCVSSYRAYTGTGVDIRNFTSAVNNQQTAPVLSVSSATGEIVDTCYCHGDDITTGTWGGGGTQRTRNYANNNTAGGVMSSATYPGAASVSVPGPTSGLSDAWEAIAASVYEPSGPPPDPIPERIITTPPTMTVASY